MAYDSLITSLSQFYDKDQSGWLAGGCICQE
jgi:hypothetical protein